MAFSLNGEWLLDCIDQPEINNLLIQLPGDVHSALLDAGKIPDPYWADNEKQVQWVGQCEWLLHRFFYLREAL